ncbi:MAG TPA: extracellular solute-binding protein [Opitutaceae bacterium]|nr:extracellular solute-binding protein [Opitutaceae bacterium]
MKRALIILALVATVALPFVLRPKQAAPENADVTLVMVTPHNEAIRHEFTVAFRQWYKARTGKTVFLDWRVLGGTTEIARFLEGEYISSFQNLWERKLGKPWSAEIQSGFQNGRLPADAPAIVKEARAAFLASEVGCGIDLFFGGGTYDFARQAAAGRIVDSGMLQLHPEWFNDDVIPRLYAGEEYWDKDGRWFGCVLSSYGIVYNHDSLQRLGIEKPPLQWEDVTDPRYLGEVALCDPTKSGSIAKAFENVIQQQMQRRLIALRAASPSGDPKAIEAQAVREGWTEGMRIMQLVGANSRYFTDTSQKPPIDVAAGNCAAGLCIDFYGRQQEEAVRRRDNNSGRLGFVAPAGGTVSSVDPIALLRGAKNKDVALALMEFVLSMDGQKLWNFKPGTPGGPQHFALRRIPLRKDYYAHPEWREFRSDPEAKPFGEREQLIYRYEWTGGIFREMAFVIRIICLDTHPELKRAWRAIIAAPEPAKSRALAELHSLASVNYDRASREIRAALSSKNKVDEVRLANDLSAEFRSHYERAERIARGE